MLAPTVGTETKGLHMIHRLIASKGSLNPPQSQTLSLGLSSGPQKGEGGPFVVRYLNNYI